jgi:hypothetical protein
MLIDNYLQKNKKKKIQVVLMTCDIHIFSKDMDGLTFVKTFIQQLKVLSTLGCACISNPLNMGLFFSIYDITIKILGQKPTKLVKEKNIALNCIDKASIINV